jgi:hypothetical protein
MFTALLDQQRFILFTIQSEMNPLFGRYIKGAFFVLKQIICKPIGTARIFYNEGLNRNRT